MHLNTYVPMSTQSPAASVSSLCLTLGAMAWCLDRSQSSLNACLDPHLLAVGPASFSRRVFI